MHNQLLSTVKEKQNHNRNQVLGFVLSALILLPVVVFAVSLI